MMLVERFRLPLPSNELVNTAVHWLIGRVRFVVSNSIYVPPIAPFVAMRFNVVPLTLMLVMCGFGLGSVTTLMVPFVIRLFVFQPSPAASGGWVTMLLKAPL